MAAAIAGISTLGIKFAYGIETVAGQKPAAFKLLDRINAIAGITLDTENIDASALEDLVTRYVAGRQDSGGTWGITVNITDETIEQWSTLIEEYNENYKNGLSMWFEVYSPNLEKAFFVVAQPPQEIPMPQTDQNGLWTVEMSLTINMYKGLDTKVEATAQGE